MTITIFYLQFGGIVTFQWDVKISIDMNNLLWQLYFAIIAYFSLSVISSKDFIFMILLELILARMNPPE